MEQSDSSTSSLIAVTVMMTWPHAEVLQSQAILVDVDMVSLDLTGMDHGVQWWCQWWDVDHDVVAARGAGPCV